MADYGSVPMGFRQIHHGMNSMGIHVISFAVISFFLFLIVLAVLFRITQKEAAMVWIIRSFFAVGAVALCLRFGVWSFWDFAWWAVLYSELVILFIYGVFSIMEASVTLRILSEITSERKGTTLKDLLHRYNKEIIVKRRVARLLYSGELIESHGAYTLGKTSYFRIREVFLEFFRKLFS